MEDTLFSKIIRGEIPSHKVYEDDYTFAFMDIYPIQPGQVVVVPKQPVESVWDLDAVLYDALMRTVYLIAHRLEAVFPTKRIALQVEGLEVPHAHVKIFPFSTAAEFHQTPDHDGAVDHEALAALAEQLRV